MKYAMVPINSKVDEEGVLHVRRVLINYKDCEESKTCIVYNKTRLICNDPYFNDQNRSHKYILSDSGFMLVSCPDTIENEQLALKCRPYHSFKFTVPGLIVPAIIFEADNDEEAIKKFNGRFEVRD